MPAMLPGAAIPQLSNTPDVIVAAGTNAATATQITNTLTMVDASEGNTSGVILPPCADAARNTPLTLINPQIIRLISLGHASVCVYPATNDPPLPISVLPAFAAFDFLPGGLGSWAAVRQW
jgi:hypothetical protein